MKHREHAHSLTSAGFAEIEGFKNGGKAWNDKIKEIDNLAELYLLESGEKELLYDLAQTGEAFSHVRDRIVLIARILHVAGYATA